MKKIINARISVKPEAIDQFIGYTKNIIEKSNWEAGCQVYKLFQEVGNPAGFIFFEVYDNQEAIDYHNSTEHFNTFISQIGPILAESPEIEVF